jgi:ABC-type branched-subunit amino acid transport system ATPase component
MEGLTVRDVTVRFGGLVALDHVSLEARVGRITGLIGPNGAGKTTMFNVCGGFLRPEQGAVEFDGGDITRLSPASRARLGIGRTFQRMQLFRSMTVRDNLALAAEAREVGDDPLTQLGLLRGGRAVRRRVTEGVDRIIDELGLGEIAGRRAGELSTGQGRLVELGRALAAEPQLLLLDEPSSGLDAAESARFGDQLRRIIERRGVGVLMVEHDMSLVLSLCEWIYVIDFGRPLMAGTPADVRASHEVRGAYLGRSAA